MSPLQSDFQCHLIARLAARVAAVPVAWVGLHKDNELVLAGGVGLPERDIERLMLLTDQALGTSLAPLAVRDVCVDDRFHDSPLLMSVPILRAYLGMPLQDAAGRVYGMLAVMDGPARDFSEEQRDALQDLAMLARGLRDSTARLEQMGQLALLDTLTGLANRTQMDQALDVELRHAMRNGEPFTVLILDLDGFADIKEGFGRVAGDEVLCEVARRLREQVRLGDVLARIGDDEFGIVMRHGGEESAQVLARRIVRSVTQPIALSDGDEVGVGVSVGMAGYDDSVESVAKLLSQAEQALFEAKQENRRRWKMFVGIR